MYKRLIVVYLFCIFLALSTFCINGCVLERVTKMDSVDFLVCPEPLVKIDSECCLDRDLNDICDYHEDDIIDARDQRHMKNGDDPIQNTEQNTEGNDIIDTKDTKNTGLNQTEKACIDKCQKNRCVGEIFFECTNSSEGCKVSKKLGKTLGECGVECFNDSDCSPGLFCNSSRCQVIELEFCGNSVCTDEENCGTCPADCLCEDGKYCNAELGVCSIKKSKPLYDLYCLIDSDQFCAKTIEFSSEDTADYDIRTYNFGDEKIICNYYELLVKAGETVSNSWQKEIKPGSTSVSMIRTEIPENQSGTINAHYYLSCFNQNEEEFPVEKNISFNISYK